MNDLAKILSLKNLLTKNNINPSENFENIYSQITDDGLKKEIESRIIDYFSKLSLPEHVTIYDQLLLSLREKDAISHSNGIYFYLTHIKEIVILFHCLRYFSCMVM
ncbi:Uncharacterised protein [Legionella pneumophila]|uniref:Uncharacterized protein n=2 Tax=Legionella pneumophila TaxID=446 RepID=A0A3A6UMG7_LEGPN|nr:hypothetical protein [Legionella pneumophila]ERB41731.1 hypothetical protein N748_07790 [Legionella pneumophila str. 121004]ERH43623.1 hypothetical protein N750_11680 [Legionella pneumophila str. Leg01/53]ERH43768.1 hypothetical protein N751_15285 [Legionella pneumophila str. Leg01/11]ERI47341.1 hypothetical protein N749_14610 [Legionella pneumophila str. Leg01/20]RJY25517.1 hypothetical protein D1H99_11065 [Legionella pneumophila subsp. pneumophila]